MLVICVSLYRVAVSAEIQPCCPVFLSQINLVENVVGLMSVTMIVVCSERLWLMNETATLDGPDRSTTWPSVAEQTITVTETDSHSEWRTVTGGGGGRLAVRQIRSACRLHSDSVYQPTKTRPAVTSDVAANSFKYTTTASRTDPNPFHLRYWP